MMELIPCHEVWTHPSSWHIIGHWITCAVLITAFIMFGDPEGA